MLQSQLIRIWDGVISSSWKRLRIYLYHYYYYFFLKLCYVGECSCFRLQAHLDFAKWEGTQPSETYTSGNTHTRALTGAQTLFTEHLCSSLAFPRSLLCPLHSFQTASRWLVDVAAHQMTATSPKASLPFYAKWAVLASLVAAHTHKHTHVQEKEHTQSNLVGLVIGGHKSLWGIAKPYLLSSRQMRAKFKVWVLPWKWNICLLFTHCETPRLNDSASVWMCSYCIQFAPSTRG